MAVDERKVGELVEQLSGEYDTIEFEEALAQVRDGVPAAQPYSSETDVGPELRPGDDGVVRDDELGHLEAIIPLENNLLPAHFLTEGAQIQGAVAKVIVDPPGSGSWSGSGFMVSRTLFMTNNHVISNESQAGDATMRFNYQYDHLGNDMPVDEFEANPDGFFYTNVQLDCTIVRLKSKLLWPWPFIAAGVTSGVAFPETVAVDTAGPASVTEMSAGASPVSSDATGAPFGGGSSGRAEAMRAKVVTAGGRWGFIPMNGTVGLAVDQRLNVVQHPRGRRKEVAIQDNKVTAIYANFVRYTSDTDYGSSGSCVLNNSWDLVALHHARGDQAPEGWYLNNEGVRIDKIAADLVATLSGSTDGQAILAELGL
jgi:endonuclease G